MNAGLALSISRKTRMRLYHLKSWGLIQYNYIRRRMSCLVHKNEEMQFPTILQLPITYKCNFDCVMCGMQEIASKPGFSILTLRKILQDQLFKEIRSIGINGGEPFILPNLVDYVQMILEVVRKVSDLYVISNGYFTDKILNDAKKIMKLCRERHVRFHLSISIDGFGEIHDEMRGKKGAFEHAEKTCRIISADTKNYCDSFQAICTITKFNIFNMPELEAWSIRNKIELNYNVGTMHKRLNNEGRYPDFSVYTDNYSRMLTAEFFYSKFVETHEERYYALFYSLSRGERLGSCDHKFRAVTLTPNGQVSYCATFSKEIGDAKSSGATNIYFDPQNLCYRKNLHQEHCNTCTHYQASIATNSFSLYGKELMRLSKIY